MEKQFYKNIIDVIGQDAFVTLFKDQNTGKYLTMIKIETIDKKKTTIPICQLQPTAEDAAKNIIPRACKLAAEKNNRQKKLGEVFTPANICCYQLNQLDQLWSGVTGFIFKVFSNFTFCPNKGKVVVPQGRTWKDYISTLCIEFTAGEGPYTSNRHNVSSKEYEIIPIEKRVGKIDRKARLVNENTNTLEEWVDGMRTVLQTTYAYDIQADSVWLTRMATIMGVIDYFQAKFGADKNLPSFVINEFAEIVSWNIFQMDVLKEAVPYDTSIPCHIKYWKNGHEILISDIRSLTKPSKVVIQPCQKKKQS